MNSAQRRKANKLYQHTVVLNATDADRYIYHDEKVQHAKAWCKKQFKDRWRSTSDWDCAYFGFTNERDATYFALKWS